LSYVSDNRGWRLIGAVAKGAAKPEALPDLVGAAQRAIPCDLAVAGMHEAVAVPGQEITSRSMQLGDAPPAGDTVS
jgi:hypothetical protein